MCDVELCRICLRNDTKFYKYDKCNLKKYYEDVMNESVNETDGLPQYFCYECAAILHKFQMFREKCFFGEKVLKYMLWNGPITYANTHNLRGKGLFKLKFMNLDILITNKRVKTYHFHHIEEQEDGPQTLEEQIIDEEFVEGPFSDEDNFPCNDPESDPVGLDHSLDFKVKEDTEEANTNVDNENTEPLKTVEVDVTHTEKMEVEKEDTETIEFENEDTETMEVENEVEAVTKKAVKRKQNQKTRQIRKSPKPIESDSDDDIELSKIKLQEKTSVISPPTKKIYKFNKPKTHAEKLACLKSDNWRRINLSDEDAMANFLKQAQGKKYLNAPYKCELCYKGFSKKSMLDRHMPQRHDESVGPLECRFCKMRFKINFWLNRHLKRHYNKYECLRCGVVCCSENPALNHEEYHSGVKRYCPYCDREFHHISSYYTHLRTHRSKHMCSLCGESFVSPFGLNVHKKMKHQADIKKSVVDADGAVYCEICKMSFESEQAYQIHRAHSALHAEENTNYLPEAENNGLAEILEGEERSERREESETIVKGPANGEPIELVVKELCTVRKSDMSRKIHGRCAKKPKSCQHCNKTFESVSACLKHHHAEHRGKSFHTQRVICEICGASLSVNSMPAHLNHHTRRKMHACDTCGRSFTTRSILKNHLVTHTGEKKYACSLCDKRFTQDSSLNLHYRTSHLKQPYPKRNRRKQIEKVEEESI